MGTGLALCCDQEAADVQEKRTSLGQAVTVKCNMKSAVIVQLIMCVMG